MCDPSSKTFLLLNDPSRMDKDRNEITKRLLDFTLEIIHLLTGENYTIVKKTSGDCVDPISRESGGWNRPQSPIMEPPPHSLIYDEKILELTHKITELLTGEVPIRCQDVTVYFSMEEWEYVEGHKELYRDIMMGDHKPLRSQGGFIDRNEPERFPSHLYSPDGPEENSDFPENLQVEDLNIKVENESEDEMMGVPMCMSEVKEEIPIYVTPGNSNKNVVFSVNSKVEDEDIMQHSSEEKLLNPNVHPELDSTDLLYEPSNNEEDSTDQLQIVTTSTNEKGEEMFHCDECGKLFANVANLFRHRRIHTGEKPYSCSECGRCFTDKSSVAIHERSHTGDKPYSCSECGKCFTRNSYLINHVRSHTGEKPYSCSECGKCFAKKRNLVLHERIHTGVKPYSCSECGTCFRQKSALIIHERSHTGEKPYSCLECGKCFKSKSELVKHERRHRGEKPYSCSECGKGFTDKSHVAVHKRSHTGEKPFSCSECEKCFNTKSDLVKHERIHTGEKPYSCSECGKRCSQISQLIVHERSHTGEKPYSCSECGKCFNTKSVLVKHERSHMRKVTQKRNHIQNVGNVSQVNLVKHEGSHTGEEPF